MLPSLCLCLLGGLLWLMVLPGCGSQSHAEPPETLIKHREPESASVYRAPLWQSSASLDQLHQARRSQSEVFENYRFRPGDAFTVVVPNAEGLVPGPRRANEQRREERTRPPQRPGRGDTLPDIPIEHRTIYEYYPVTVMPDGKIYVPFLDQGVAVEGLAPDEVSRRLARGSEPLISCINCGYWYAPSRSHCPACGASQDDRVHTPRITLSKEARQQIVVGMGGLCASEAEPLRPTSVPGYWWAICEQGLVGLVEQSSERYVFRQAEVVWRLYLGRTHLAERTLSEPKRERELYLPVQRAWYHLDLITGETSRVSSPPSGLTSRRVPRAPQPQGLAAELPQPEVRIAEVEPEPLNYSVNVTGALNEPQRMPVRQGSRLWDAITEAGGPRLRDEPLLAGSVHEEAMLPAVDWRGAVLMREAQYLPAETLPPGTDGEDLVRLDVDFEKLADGDARQNVPLMPGDLVYVPEYRPQQVRINVAGEVGEPGSYYFASPPDLMTALLNAGWVDRRRGKTQAIYLVRPNRKDGTRDVYRLHALAVARGHAPNLDLRDGDMIFVDTDALTDVGDALDKISPIFRFSSEPATSYLRWRVLLDEFE